MKATIKNRKERIAIFLLLASLTIVVTISTRAFAEGNVAMNVVAANETDEKKQGVIIRQDLPSELKKEDIVESGGLLVKYDEERSIYYLYAETDIDPKSTKTYKVMLRDLWQIAAADVDFIKEEADRRLESLKGTDSFAVAQAYRDAVVSQLHQIISSGESEGKDILKRIESHRLNLKKIEKIRTVISSSDNFIKEAQAYAAPKKGDQTIKLIIEAANPSETEALEKSEVLKYLPEGLDPNQISDLMGFEAKYDHEKKLYYLTNLVDLKPGETKKFVISIISEGLIFSTEQLDALKMTDSFTTKLVGTSYEKLAAYLAIEITRLVQEIKDRQNGALSAEDKIAAYTLNTRNLKQINENIEQLRRLVEAGEKAKVKKLSEVIKTVTPDVATTWKIIYATIAFLTVISIFFYFLWWGQSKAKQNQKLDEITTPEKGK